VASLASLSFEASGVLAALLSEAVAGGDVVTGADVVIAEILIERSLVDAPDCDRLKTNAL
jgi:hypothetical protein